jgi:two-component system response regulator PilR (NtrC family)
LFLDEIAELPMHMQVKLLRVIQEKAVRPIGAGSEEAIDVRILSATHKDLGMQVAHGSFRQDLFYRIHVIELLVPPLRERHEDVAQLVAHMLARHASEAGTAPARLTPAALRALVDHPFPGNVRELENVLERAVALCEGGMIDVADLHLATTPVAGEVFAGDESGKPGASRTGDKPAVPGPGGAVTGDLASAVAETERIAIMTALEATRWNRTVAARRLGLTLRQLRYRLEKLGIE